MRLEWWMRFYRRGSAGKNADRYRDFNATRWASRSSSVPPLASSSPPGLADAAEVAPVVPRADDHCALVVLPADYSAQVDWAADDSVPAGCCSAEADSVPADCWAAPRADAHCAPVALADDYYSAPADWAADDSAPAGCCSAEADSVQGDCWVAPRADAHCAPVALPADYYSAPVDWAADDSAPAGCCLAGADSEWADSVAPDLLPDARSRPADCPAGSRSDYLAGLQDVPWLA